MTLRNCTGQIATAHRLFNAFKKRGFKYTVNGRIPQGDFPAPTEDLISAYIKSKWLLTSPAISTNPPSDLSTNLHVTDYDYTNCCSYHAKIVQDEATTFENELQGVGLLGLDEPILIELTARRLTYGKAFEELDNIRLEIIRIIKQFEPNDNLISGVQSIDIVDPGDIQRQNFFLNKLPQSIWRSQVKLVVCHYKNWYIDESA